MQFLFVIYCAFPCPNNFQTGMWLFVLIHIFLIESPTEQGGISFCVNILKIMQSHFLPSKPSIFPVFFRKYQTVTEASRPILSNIPRGEFSLFIHAFVMVLPPMERNCTTQALKSNICICRAGKRKNIYFVPVIWRMIHTRFLNIDMWCCSYSQNRTYTGTESCNVN